jgi:hypothetical protein
MRRIWRVTSAWTKFARLNARRGIGAVMDEVAQYRKYADECRGLAATAKKLEQKKQLPEMAAAWDTVARRQKSGLAKTADESAAIFH